MSKEYRYGKLSSFPDSAANISGIVVDSQQQKFVDNIGLNPAVSEWDLFRSCLRSQQDVLYVLQ